MSLKITPVYLFRVLLLLPSLYFVTLFIYAVLHRIHYPMELELIEGSSVNHALRILQGEALYAKPAFEFTANLYTPLFYYCGAAFSTVMGIGFASLRAVSVCAVLATWVVIALFVYRESKSTTAALTAVGLYAATYAASGGWMDLARVDSLFVALLLAAIFMMRYARHTADITMSAVLFVLAFYSKQSALIAIAPLMAYALLALPQPSHRFLLPCLVGGLLLLSLGLADWLSDRWFSYYTIVMPAGHPDNSNNVREFWRHDLIQVMPLAIVCSLALIAWLQIKEVQIKEVSAKKTGRDALFFLVFLFAMALASYLTRINKGGYYNTLMPIYAALTIVMGVFIGKVLLYFETQPGVGSRRLLIAATAAMLLQFGCLNYDQRSYIPGKEDWIASERLLKDLRAVEGNVYSLDYGFIGHLVGKPNFVHATAIGDIKLSRYRYWAETDLQPFAEQQISIVSEGLDRNGVNALVLISEQSLSDPNIKGERRTPEARLGKFVLKEYYPGKLQAQRWSQSTPWLRSWPTRTMFQRPDVMLYIRG